MVILNGVESKMNGSFITSVIILRIPPGIHPNIQPNNNPTGKKYTTMTHDIIDGSGPPK